MVAAGIDIGSNTVLMVVAEVDRYGKINVFHEAHEIPRLAQGLGENGGITVEAVQRATSVLAEYRSIISQFGNPRVTAVATAALRSASNREKVRKTLEHVLGAPIHVLSGQQEAMLTFAGTTAGVFGPATVLDIGGGSTEIVHGMDGRASWAQSLPIGCVYLTEQYQDAHPLQAQNRDSICYAIDDAITSCHVPFRVSSGSFLAVAGTATTIAMLNAGISSYDTTVLSGYQLTIDRAEFWANSLLSMDLNTLQELPGVDIRRSDVLPVGALILHRVMQNLGAQSVQISVKGLRYGALLNAFGLV